MARPTIIYYGVTGLESMVFQQYMRTLGYRVELVNSLAEIWEAIKLYPETLIVLSLLGIPETIVNFAKAIREHPVEPEPPIFILSDDPFRTNLTATEVFPRPYSLRQVVDRIQKLQRQHA